MCVFMGDCSVGYESFLHSDIKLSVYFSSHFCACYVLEMQ